MRKWFIALLVILFLGLIFVISTISGSTLAQSVINRTISSWPWYVVRGSGLVAGVSLMILLLSGVGFITGHSFKFLEPITAWASHRALGIAFGVSILIHMAGLLLDHFVPFNLINLLIPWSSSYKPVTIFGVNLGSIYVSLGVMAFYMVALITMYSLLWIDKKPYSWKLTHLLSYVVFVFVFIHALYLGTDLAGGILRLIWILLGIGVSIAIIVRLRRSRTV